MIYRNQLYPYDILGPSELRDYFITNPPALWRGNLDYEERFRKVYGDIALAHVRQTGLVPENIDPAWVGGTDWSGKIWDQHGRVAYRALSIPPGGMPGELPAPPWERPDFTGLSKGETAILQAVLRVEGYLKTKLG